MMVLIAPPRQTGIYNLVVFCENGQHVIEERRKEKKKKTARVFILLNWVDTLTLVTTRVCPRHHITLFAPPSKAVTGALHVLHS